VVPQWCGDHTRLPRHAHWRDMSAHSIKTVRAGHNGDYTCRVSNADDDRLIILLI